MTLKKSLGKTKCLRAGEEKFFGLRDLFLALRLDFIHPCTKVEIARNASCIDGLRTWRDQDGRWQFQLDGIASARRARLTLSWQWNCFPRFYAPPLPCSHCARGYRRVL